MNLDLDSDTTDENIVLAEKRDSTEFEAEDDCRQEKACIPDSVRFISLQDIQPEDALPLPVWSCKALVEHQQTGVRINNFMVFIFCSSWFALIKISIKTRKTKITNERKKKN